MREESAYPLPEDTIFEGMLVKVDERNIKGTSAKGKAYDFNLWEWEFVITSGEYQGLKATGTTEDHLNNLEEPRGRAKLARPWYETLLGRQIAIGEAVDTDTQIVGLPCKFTVKHEEPRPKKDGGFWYGCEVEDVFPATPAATAASHSSPAPF